MAFSPHFNLYSCLSPDEPSFFDYHTSHGLLRAVMVDNTPCDQVFAYCKKTPKSSFASALRHDKSLLEEVLRKELAMGLYSWSPSDDGDEETVLKLSDSYKFLESLSTKHIKQTTTYEVLKYATQAKQEPGEHKVTLRLNLGHLKGILKPSFFVIETPSTADVAGVHVRYRQNDMQVTDEKGLIFKQPKHIPLDTDHSISIPKTSKQMFLLQAPTKWPVGDRRLLEKIFYLFRRDNNEMDALHTLLRSASQERNQAADSVSEMTGELSRTDISQGEEGKEAAYTINGPTTVDSPTKGEESASSESKNEGAASESYSSMVSSTKGTGNKPETSGTQISAPSFTQVTDRDQEDRQQGGTSLNPTTDISEGMTGTVNTTTNLSISKPKPSEKAASLSGSESWDEPESEESSSEVSETRVKRETVKTEPTHEAEVENGGMFYDSTKMKALSTLLPYMQGVTDGIFTVTLDLTSTPKRAKKFRVSIEVLAARQCLEK